MTVQRIITVFAVLGALIGLSGCMSWDYGDSTEDFEANAPGLFICCEGNFQYGNATLSYYDPATGLIENEVFVRANGMRLGDVAQSMTMWGDRAWIVVNNSHVIFAIDPVTFREVGRIENLTSPRYIHFVSPTKAYVSQLWDNRIFIINPSDYSITGYIGIPDMDRQSGSTEQMVQLGRYVYCSCWSYQNCIIRIDTTTDQVTGRLTVGIQPRGLVADCRGKLWTITDGGVDGSPYGTDTPALVRIDPESFTVEARYHFSPEATPAALQTNADGTRLYWIDEDVWTMDVTAERLPTSPAIPSRDTRYYGLTVSPTTGEIYVADAIDYQQQGMILRYNADGQLLDQFYVGITPGAFCWKP